MSREREYSGPEQIPPFNDKLIRYTLDAVAHLTFPDKGENFDTACKLLKNNSLLMAANHPKMDTFWGMNAIATTFQPNTRGFYTLANERLLPGGDDTLIAKIVRKLCTVSHVQLMPIYLANKGWDRAERAKGNSPTILSVIQKLSEAGNLFFIYPEGDFNFKMNQAKRGLGEMISQQRGFTVPVTTNVHPLHQHFLTGLETQENFPAINIHKPISNEQLYRLCLDVCGERSQSAQQLASDTVMSVIAHGLPAERRGFYESLSATLYAELYTEQTELSAHADHDQERLDLMALASGRMRPLIM